jgi:hypothetical protein
MGVASVVRQPPGGWGLQRRCDARGEGRDDDAKAAVDALAMHGTRPTARPIAALRRRGGVIGQRLLAAALPGLADLRMEVVPAPVRAIRVAERSTSSGRTPSRHRTIPAL